MANDELVFVCIQCGHGCSSYEDLTNHMEDHEDQKPDIRQLRKSTVFGKGKCSGKFGKGGKKSESSINDDFKTESDGQRSRMYSYPSYISIGTNNLDDIDPTWSQGNDFGNRKDIEPGRPKDMAAKSSTKGTSKNKQVQGKQTNKHTSKQTPAKKISNKQQTSKQAQNRQTSSKQTPTMKTPSKQAQAMKLQTVKTTASTNGQKNKMATASKKLVNNKRKATAEVASGLKNAKLKKGEPKAKNAETLIQDVRRRSTNSMRLRKMTSAGEICHDDSSESMSESEKLAEAIRRSKIETSMTSVEKETLQKNGTSDGSLQNRTKVTDFDNIKEKKNNIERALTKGKHSSAEKFCDKKNRFIGTNKEHFIGHFKTNQKKTKKLLRTKSELPSMVLTKRELTSYREGKSNATVKRSTVATSKATPTTLMGKIIPIQAPMMWKLVNSSQQQQPDAIDLKKIQSMKNNATLKFTGEQKVLITFNQNNDNPSSSGVKTIIANVTSPSKETTKSSSGVKTRQAVLLPLSVVGDAPNAAGGQISKLADGSRQPIRILRSNTKSVSTLSNYSIIPLSSLIACSAVVSSIPHLLSAVQKNSKSSVDTQITSSSQKPISSPAKADTTTVGAVSQNTSITTQVGSPVKLVMVSSIASSSVKVTPTTLQAFATATLPKATTFATVNQTSIVTSSVQALTSPSISKQAFLPQSSKTLIIKHSANNSQVFTLIPTAGQQLLPRTTNQIGPNATNSGTVTSAVTQSQLLRPIFITAQPKLMPQKTAPGANKSGPITPTTQQAVFIAAGPINQGSSQSAASIQLTLSPSKSLLAGAIPVIVGPQMVGGSAANLSSQIQLALSQLQCQNLTAAASGATTSTTGLQTKTVAGVSQSIGVRSDGQSVTVIKAVSSSKMMPTILRRNPNTSTSTTSLSGSSAVRKIVFPQESPAKGLLIKEPPVIITTTASKRQTRQSVQRSKDIACSMSDAVAAQINAVNPGMACGNDVTSGELQLSNKTTDIPEKEDLLSGIDGSKQCVTSEKYNKSQGPGIFDYLPTLPGACTTPVTPVMKSPVTERLLLQIPLSKLSRKPVMNRLEKEDGAHGANDKSQEKDLADIRKIIQHTASFELPFPSQNALLNGKINNTSIATAFPSTVEAAYQPSSLSILSASQSGLSLQKFVQILPAVSQKIIMTSVSSSLPTGGSALIPNLSVINTPALRTPIVTPVVTSAAAAPACRDINKTVPNSIPDRLQVSIKLASISSGARLKNSKPINVVPAISQIPVGIKATSLPTPLLPRPTQGFLTLLAPKPTTTLANQMQATATVGNLQRFPLTYLTTVPLQIGNRPRAQVMIQPTQRGILNASFASTAPTAAAPTNIRFGTQTMVIPVSLSIPGMNLQQGPVTSNILFSSLYPVVPASSLIQTQVRPKACVNVVPSQTLIHANSGNVTRLQKIAPYPSSSVSVKLAISKGLTVNSKPVSAKPNVIGGSGIDGQDSSIVDATSIVNSLLLPIETRVSSEEPSSKPENSIETIQSTATTSESDSTPTSTGATYKETSSSNIESLSTALAAVSNDCESKQVGTTTPCEDGIVSFTNTLRSLLKADISEGSTVTINIQGNPVTYALKDGKLFSMPHDKPTKVEKNESKIRTSDQKKTDDKEALSSEASSSGASSSKASSSEATSSRASSSIASTALQSALHSTVTSSVTTCAGTSPLQSSTNLSFCNTNPISSTTVQSSISLRRKSDLPAPCSRLLVSVPKSLLLRKIRPFRSVSADLPSVEICEPHVQISKQSLNDAIFNVTNASSSIAECSTAVTSVVRSNSNIVVNETNTPENKFPCKIESKRSSSDIEERKSENSEENGENGAKEDNFDLTFGFECDFCSDKFASYNLMWRHRKLHLNDTANFSSLHRTSLPRALCPKFAVCESCNKVFQSTSDLEKHKLTDSCGNASQVIPNENFNTLEPVSSSTIGFTQHVRNSLDSALSSSNSNHTPNSVNSKPGFMSNETSNRGLRGTEIDTTFDMDSFQLDPQAPHVHNGTHERVDDQSLGCLLSDLTSDFIGSTAPAVDLGTDVIGNVMGSFDLNANFDDQVFEENVDVKPDLKPAKRMRRPSGKPGAPRKRILSRKHSNPGKVPLSSNKRNRKRSRVTISDDEETFDDGGLDLDGEFITVGKLHGEFTCSRCDLGFQNEKELDEHNETFHDSLRYNFRERRSVTNLDYLDEFEFDFD